MKKENLKKIAVITLIHVVELVIMYFISIWIWNNIATEYRLWLMGAFIGVYVLYFVVTTMNDYKEIKYGIESHFF